MKGLEQWSEPACCKHWSLEKSKTIPNACRALGPFLVDFDVDEVANDELWSPLSIQAAYLRDPT